MVKYGTNASGAIWWENLQLMQMAPSGGQIWNQYASGTSSGKIGNKCKWRHLVAKFATNSSSSTEINFELFYLKDLLKLWTPGSVVHLAMFFLNFLLLRRAADVSARLR